MPVFPSLRALVSRPRSSAALPPKGRRKRSTRAFAIEWLERRDLLATGITGITLADQFNLNSGSASIPPDTMGAVGPNHFVEVINSSLAIYSKTTGTRLQYVNPDVFFASVRIGGTFDPRVTFDRESGRWFMTIMEFGSNGTNNNDVLLAVSKTSNPTYAVSPTDSWNFYRLGINVSNAFTDYSSLGVDSNGVYFGATYFPSSGSYVKIFATPKAPLLAASPSLGTVTASANITDMYSTPQPITSINPVTGGTAAFFLAASTTVFGNVTYRSVTWSGSTPTLAASTSTVTTPSYGAVRNAPALGSTTLINAGDDRIIQVVQRNGQVYATRNVGVNAAGTGATTTNRTAVEWLQFNVSGSTLSLNQSGRVFDPAATNAFSYYYPSLTVNGQGVVRMAYSGSNAVSFVSAYSSVHLPTDAAGAMSAPTSFVTGQASYTRNDSGGRNRWGDYSYTSLDPNDDMTAWTIQEFAAANGLVGASTVTSNWGTFIQSFDALTPTLNNPSATATQGTNGNVLNLTGTNFYDPGAGFTNRLTVSVSGTGVTVTNVTYNSPTSLTVTYNVAAGATIGGRNITVTNPDGQSATATNGLTIQAAAVATTVTGVSSTAANGSYGVGSLIPITVTFSGPVTVTGFPTLALNSGGTATYSSGSGSSTLTFNYTVAAGQTSADLDYTSTSALALSGGTINDGSSNPATLTLPSPGSAGSLGANKAIVIDGVAPTVSGISSTSANGSYGTGSVITITVGFSEAVNVTGTPTLALNSGGTASYTSGAGTSTLTFTYTVAAGQAANPLDAASAAALSGTIKDTVTNNPNAAVLTVPVSPASGSLAANKSLVIDAIAPTVTGVNSSTANGSYGVGSVITITVGFSEAVNVTGTPTLALNSGGTASYTSGTGTSTLTFTYTVGAGQSASPLDAASAAALAGTIKDTVTNNPNAAVLTLPVGQTSGSLASNKSIVVDGIAPTVSGISSTTANGTYGIGAVITITVGFSEAVNVTGTPTLALNSGGTASYTSGTGTSTLTFTYTVAAGQAANPLDAASTGALSGTIKDTVTNNPNAAVLTVPVAPTAGALAVNKTIIVDTATPSVTGLTSPSANGSYGAGSVITISVSFDRSVAVTGLPTLALNSGGTATYSSGSGTSTLNFTYTVAAGQTANPLDAASTAALTGTIKDVATNNPASLVVPVAPTAGALGVAKSIVIDAVAPTVTGLSSTSSNGLYGIGAVITITVGFSESVSVTGTPTLALNSGGTATYASGSGTSTLSFTYTVGVGQSASPLDAASAAALTGTIKDTVTNNPNPAVLTVPVSPASTALGVAKSLNVDGIAPTVSQYQVLFGSRSYNVIGSARYDLPWQISGVRVVFNEPITTGVLASLTGLPTTGFSGLGTNTLTWAISPTFQGSFSTLLAGTGGNALKDAAGNALGNGANFTQAFKVLEGDFDDNGVVDARDMVGINAAIAAPYNPFADINGDGVVDTNDVKASRKRVGLTV